MPTRAKDHHHLAGVGSDPYACPEHPTEKVQVWCEECDDAFCMICSISKHGHHRLSFLKDAVSEKRQQFIVLAEEANRVVDRLKVTVDDSLAIVEEEASCVRKEVKEWANIHVMDLDAIIARTRAEIKRLEEEIKCVEEKRKAIKQREAELYQAISRGSQERSTTLNTWKRGVHGDLLRAEELLEIMQRSLSKDEFDPLGALRSKKELSKIVEEKASQPVPVVPEPPLLLLGEKPGPEVPAALCKVHQALTDSNPKQSIVNEAIEKLHASGGALFGEQGLAKRVKQLFPRFVDGVTAGPSDDMGPGPSFTWNPSAICGANMILSEKDQVVSHEQTGMCKAVLATAETKRFKIQVLVPGANSHFMVGFALENKFDAMRHNYACAGWYMHARDGGLYSYCGDYCKEYASTCVGKNDFVEACWDLENGTISFKINNVCKGIAFKNVFRGSSDRLLPAVDMLGVGQVIALVD